MSFWRRRAKPILEAGEHIHFTDMVLEAVFGLRTGLISVAFFVLTFFFTSADPTNWSPTAIWLASLMAAAIVAVIVAAITVTYQIINRLRPPAKMQAEADDKTKQLEQTQATLTLSGPHLHNDHRFKNKNHWRMKVHNAGPAGARNVQMKLRSGASEPKDSNWTGDYPYAVYPVGTIKNDPGHISSTGRQINANDDEGYEIICGWRAEGGQFFTDINTKGGGHNNIQINSDERWKLSYEVTAENALPKRFVLEIFIYDNEVTVATVI